MKLKHGFANRRRQIILLIARIPAIPFCVATLIVLISAVGRYAFSCPNPDAFDASLGTGCHQCLGFCLTGLPRITTAAVS